MQCLVCLSNLTGNLHYFVWYIKKLLGSLSFTTIITTTTNNGRRITTWVVIQIDFPYEGNPHCHFEDNVDSHGNLNYQ